MDKHPYRKLLADVLLSAILGLAAVCVCIAVSALLIRFLLKDMSLAGVFASASLIIGSFTGSYICGHYRRRYGIFLGIACGAAIYIILSAAGLIINGSITDIRKLLLLAVSGTTGGVYGVNSKHPFFSRH